MEVFVIFDQMNGTRLYTFAGCFLPLFLYCLHLNLSNHRMEVFVIFDQMNGTRLYTFAWLFPSFIPLLSSS